jgi:hypothetical protein
MRSLIAGLVLLALSACVVAPRAVELSWGPNPWYTYCTWAAPCWYSDDVIFVYRWGSLSRSTYAYLSAHPGERDGWSHRRRDWHPNDRPEYRGQDWDHFKKTRHERERHDQHHGARDS